MALFKILNNLTSKNAITSLADEQHVAGYCYFDANTNKFYIDTQTGSASGMRQLNGTFYGECIDLANVAGKSVTIPGFSLVKGVSVFILFSNTNTAAVANLTLNVSNTGDIPIKRYGTTNLASASNLRAGKICQFVYDGTNWLWVGDLDTNSDTKVRQSINGDNLNRPLLLGYSDISVATLNVDNIAYRNNSIYANPSTGTITATNFSGLFNGHTIESDVPVGALFTDTTYTAGNGINITNNKIYNSGVRTIGAGTKPGTLMVNINGTQSEITIPGLGGNGGSSGEGEISDYYAPINSPNFTGTPTAPTPTTGDNSTAIATTAFVTNAVSSLSGPMRFIGTLGENGTTTSLATATEENKGHTYKVITGGTYQNITAKVGDVLVSTGTTWVLIPSGDEPAGTVTNIATGDGLSGGPISTTGTISHAIPAGAFANTYNNTDDSTFIKKITTDKFGHITNVTTGNTVAIAEKVSHTLTFGAHQAFTYDGSEDVNVPVYGGAYIG